MSAPALIRPAIWHGSLADETRLRRALVWGCAARDELDADGRSDERCYQCGSCLTPMDQADMDRLAFVGYLRQKWLDGEYAG